ncbi:uncharacterized protein LOC110649620 isoform X3 [Hevea brasiliensis]|uniref:uncharacterized protein LOC110649620 isoform X3 n=1 Tax=Hevea brasiliensis TaxID=3981 RepID=UPI0025EDCD36|nr:uncharacterized protein LOC110649620 isoform X3 [Hevea brasiliensis]
MMSFKPSLKRNAFFDGGKCGLKMKQLPFMGVLFTVMLFIVYRTTIYQYQHTQMESKLHPFDTLKESALASGLLGGLPLGIIQASSDLELKPLWSSSSSRSKVDNSSHRNLLAIPVGIKQKDNVDAIVQKFLPENFTVILFHYDGNLDGWFDLEWSNKAIHIVAQNQTKWWCAKRFLHPAVVSIYDYIFLWDEDLGVENFDPGRYLEIVKSEGLEISQPALDPNSTDIHHRITIRSRMKKLHRRVYDSRGSTKCSDVSEGPPCTGFVEGMAPVFSRSAWYCAWHLIQNDLVHGWGVDMKLGYCAQTSHNEELTKRHGASPMDPRMELLRSMPMTGHYRSLIPFYEVIKNTISEEIEDDPQTLQNFAYGTYLGLILCLSWNLIAVASLWIKGGVENLSLFLAIAYLVLGIPAAYASWYRTLSLAFREENPSISMLDRFLWFYLFTLASAYMLQFLLLHNLSLAC